MVKDGAAAATGWGQGEAPLPTHPMADGLVHNTNLTARPRRRSSLGTAADPLSSDNAMPLPRPGLTDRPAIEASLSSSLGLSHARRRELHASARRVHVPPKLPTYLITLPCISSTTHATTGSPRIPPFLDPSPYSPPPALPLAA